MPKRLHVASHPNLTLATKLVALAMVGFAFSLSTARAASVLDRALQSLEQVREKGERGDMDAQFVLGFMYQEGKPQGVPQDYAEAARWYRLAADQGYYAAMHELGLMYFEGKGVPEDYAMAYMWLNLAAARSPARETNAAEARDLVASRLTKAQIAEGQKLARQWSPR
jgi:TPR repeat protein